MDRREEDKIIEGVTSQEYKEGFVTDIRQEFIPKGLDESIIRKISSLKEEPDWLLEFRLEAFRKWQAMEMPNWGHIDMPPIDFQDIIYYHDDADPQGFQHRSQRTSCLVMDTNEDDAQEGQDGQADAVKAQQSFVKRGFHRFIQRTA